MLDGVLAAVEFVEAVDEKVWPKTIARYGGRAGPPKNRLERSLGLLGCLGYYDLFVHPTTEEQ